MINLPCNVASMSQVAPCQSVPVQTSQYNFPICQQRQTSTQQTAACGPCSGTSQGPFAHVYQPDTYVVTHQCAPQSVTNPCHPVFQNPCNPPPSNPSCGQLPQNILDQIRACVSNAAPIFILPGNCQQSPVPQQQQQPTLPQAMATGFPPPTATAYPSSGLTYPAACYPPPPSYYPYPVPVPFYDPSVRARDIAPNCGCCGRRDVDSTQIRSVARTIGCRYDSDLDEHHCVPTTDDTICAKRSCPSSLHLQALASQFLSMQGIIACAATRLILRKVPGSNVTTTMEDTMAKAQKAINVLTKDQLLSESRNAQQVNALINLHMTANPPPNIIPILTLVQLKMNLLKAQVEGLVNQKIMETQGVGVEVETDLIDPTVLALKSDAELRDFLSILRQKECDERVNVNFAPYRSQRAIAETRLSNIQNKIRQVEAEFDRRRCAMFPAPTLTSRVVQEFSRPCYSARFRDPRLLYSTLPPDIPRSPDPFVCVKPRSPKRLLLKPCGKKPETKSTQVTAPVPATSTPGNPSKTTTDDGGVGSTKEPPATADLQQSSSTEDCRCDRTTSDESVDEAKKKLRPRIVEINASNVEKPSSLMKLTSNVCVRYGANARKCDGKSDVETPCEAKRWMAKAYINVADDESGRTLTGSESDTITLSEKIDAEDVCERLRDAIEIRGLGQIMDRQEFTSSADLRQFEKQAETAIAISRKNEAIKEYDIETRRLQDVSSPKAERTEMKTITIAEVTDDEPISSAIEETERKSPNDYTSSLEITLKSKRDRHEDEQKDKNDKILSAIETMEQSANQVPISKSKKKTRFHIVSLMTNIVYNNENCKYRGKRRIDKKIATREMSITNEPDIEKLDKYNSIENLRNVIAHDITGKNYSHNMFLRRLEDFSKFCVDRQCQTTSVKKTTTSAFLLRVNLFPPFKNLHKYMADNERNGNDIGVYPSPITKAGITARKRLFHWNDVAKNTSETRHKDNARYPPSSVECEESFVSEIFSVIANRVITFVNKIITLNGRLSYPNCGAILRKSVNIDALRRNVPKCNHPDVILKDHDPLASILHRPLDSNREAPGTSKRDIRDASLLRVSTGEGYNRMRKIRHSIIQDKENDMKCLLIDTSSRDCNLTQIRNLGRPYKVQRTLLIRSRLKNRLSTQNHPHPFSLLKRTGKNISQKFHQVRRNENVGMIKERKIRKLRSSEKFWALSKVIKTRDKISEMRECDIKFKQVLREYSHDDIMNNNAFTVQKHAIVDNIIADDEFVINVHDYSGFQTEINTNMYENPSVCLLLSNN
ncbi:uncharacterized protein LOC115237422 isoform X2 [Formica exsecta]|uniref:uncharacterized protein LOC115237422 isoform X2 n=2 Tax=Formica exsecta TaxID=72781 RepID=UPI001142E69A|nr:uncharacterized protein LOC115237422 isoform X2 [Formica exsecta]